MKNILIIVLIFISITSTAKAVYETVKYRDVSDMVVMTSKYFDEQGLVVVKFEDMVSPSEKSTCYMVQRFGNNNSTNKLTPIPNISCVK